MRQLALACALFFVVSTGLAEAQPAPVAASPAAAAQPAAAPQVLISTSMGDMTVALDRAHAPVSVDNFLRYVNPIALEANNGLSNLRGTLSMAREEAPNTASAEFFINLADNTRLDHHADDTGNTTGYAVFGHVVSGMDVVDKIAAVPLGDNGPMAGQAPVTPITISKVTLLP
jgi:peptidyl-prolyl cis-trans isomerase A (cyclophilin A)